MNHINLIFGFSFLLFVQQTKSQTPSIVWQKCFGGTGSEAFFLGSELNNGGFIATGGTTSVNGNVSGNHGNGDFWVLKLDVFGNMISQRCYGGSDNEGGPCFPHPDGRVSIVGTTNSNDGDVIGNHQPGVPDAWLADIDTNGDVIFQRCYGGSDYDIFISSKSTHNSGYIIAGSTGSIDGDVTGGGLHGNTDCWVVKIDSSRNIQSQKCFGGSGTDFSVDVFTTGSSYVIGGNTNSSDGDVSNYFGGWDFWIFKVDSLGNKIWDKSYGGSQDDFLSCMLQCNDGGYLLSGYTLSGDGWVSGRHDTLVWQMDVWVVKVDSDGDFQWQKCYGGNGDDYCHNISKTFDGGFILCCTTTSNDGDVSGNHGMWCAPYWCNDAWILNIDSIGNILWQKCMGGSDGEEGDECIQTLDSGFLFVGSTFSFDGDVTGSFNHGNEDAWVVKLSPATVGIPLQTNKLTNLFCYQFPTKHTLSVSFYSDFTELSELQILDIDGREILNMNLKMNIGFNKYETNIGWLSHGIYLLRILTKSEIITKKIFIE